jgi:hypothetical protein
MHRLWLLGPLSLSLSLSLTHTHTAMHRLWLLGPLSTAHTHTCTHTLPPPRYPAPHPLVPLGGQSLNCCLYSRSLLPL